jgi:hypothetical protein
MHTRREPIYATRTYFSLWLTRKRCQHMAAWTGAPIGAIDRLRLPFRVMLCQQAFTLVDAHVAELELKMTRSLTMPRGRPRATARRLGAEHVPQVQRPWMDWGDAGAVVAGCGRRLLVASHRK